MCEIRCHNIRYFQSSRGRCEVWGLTGRSRRPVIMYSIEDSRYHAFQEPMDNKDLIGIMCRPRDRAVRFSG